MKDSERLELEIEKKKVEIEMNELKRKQIKREKNTILLLGITCFIFALCMLVFFHLKILN